MYCSHADKYVPLGDNNTAASFGTSAVNTNSPEEVLTTNKLKQIIKKHCKAIQFN